MKRTLLLLLVIFVFSEQITKLNSERQESRSPSPFNSQIQEKYKFKQSSLSNTLNRVSVINGVLIDVQARFTLNFNQKILSRPFSITNFPTQVTSLAQTNQQGTNFDKQIPNYYITKIVGYNDRQFQVYPWHLHRVQFTFTSVDGSKPQSVISIGNAFNPVDKQQFTGSINIDYSTSLIKQVIVGFDQWTLISVQVITVDGNSQKFDGKQYTSIVNYTTFDISGGYLVGLVGKSAAGINSMQFKYKKPL